ncbi:MAG: DUF1566 domain-containing protein [Acidobacteria bacterium]|nr:MAG: DUF1566 domain-containing protein [Acidobacteriota bacterium]
MVRALICTVLAGLVVSHGQAVAQSPPDETSQTPVFTAPFATVEFLDQITAAEEERRILEEKLTKVFMDLKSGLMWAARDNGRDIDWRRAMRYCDDLELASYSDWRLPALDELEGLYRAMSASQYKVPGEIRLTSCCPWSSTKKSEDSAWNFNFQYRKPFSGGLSYTYDLRALCVRTPVSGESHPLPEKPKKKDKKAKEQKG